MPRLPGAEKGYGNRLSTVYFTDMKVAATAASVRNLLLHDGWQAFAKPFGVKTDSPNFVRDEYRKQGDSLRVLVSAASTDDKKGRSSVELPHWRDRSSTAAHRPKRPKWSSTTSLCLMQCTVPRDLQARGRLLPRRDGGTRLRGGAGLPQDEAEAVIVFTAKDQEALVCHA